MKMISKTLGLHIIAGIVISQLRTYFALIHEKQPSSCLHVMRRMERGGGLSSSRKLSIFDETNMENIKTLGNRFLILLQGDFYFPGEHVRMVKV